MTMHMKKMSMVISEVVKPLRNRIMMTISRAVIETINDAQNMQIAKISLLASEVRDKVERFQNFGFTSNPPSGSEALVCFVAGNREHGVIVACDDRRVRVKSLASGESAVYTDDGTIIHLKKGGFVEVKAATRVLIDCPETEMTGNCLIKGNLTVEGNETVEGNSQVDGNETVNGIQAAGSFSGIGGGAVQASVNISTTGNVIGGGTDLASVKSTFNTHTHDENGTGGGTTDAPNSSL